MKVQPLHVASAALLVVLASGCASIEPDPPVSTPRVAGAQPATPTPQPAVKPVAPVTSQPAPAALPAKAPPAPAPGKVVPPVARATAPVVGAPKPATPPATALPSSVTPAPLDLKALTEQLKATKAIGIFTKLSLKNKVDDLLRQFRQHYEGKGEPTMAELRQSYNLLMMKVLSLLQDDDQTLASAIVSSREPIWALLANPKTFAALQI